MAKVMEDDELDPVASELAEHMRMALADAGYPQAHVYVEWSGVFVENVPDAVAQKAFDVCNC